MNVGQAELSHIHGRNNIPFEVSSEFTDMITASKLTKWSTSNPMLQFLDLERSTLVDDLKVILILADGLLIITWIM